MSENLIYDENILIDLEATDKNDALSQISDLLERNGFVKASFKEAVIEREDNYATGLPTHFCSVAIPHTDIVHVIQPTISVAVLKNEVSFIEMGSFDQETEVKIIFMLAVNKSDDQLVLLQQLMQIFQSEEKLKNILNAKQRTEIANLMKQFLVVQ